MREGKSVIKFKSRMQSIKGIVAFIIAVVGMLATMILLVIASSMGGETGLLTGILALLFTVLASVGFVLALKALYERDILPALPIAALLMNGSVVIFYLCIYVIGI